MRIATGLAVIFVLAAGPAGAAATADAETMVALLLASPPRQLSQLEAVVGGLRRDVSQWQDAVGPLDRLSPSPGIARVRAALAIDMYHQDPPKVADPSLAEYLLEFPAGREAARRLLAAAFPGPAELAEGGEKVWRYGDFYFRERGAADGFALAWYSFEPLFAIPARGPEETAALGEKLAAVAAAQFSLAAVERHFGKLQPVPRSSSGEVAGPTWRLEYSPAGAEFPKTFALSLKRPLPAEKLVARLGLRRPVVTTVDVHMRSRVVAEMLDYEEHLRQVEQRSAEVEGRAPAGARSYQISISVDYEGLQKTGGRVYGLWSIEGAGIRSFAARLEEPPSARPLIFPVEPAER
jgi:hypothetical protein